jgi:hypothetical protein
MSTHHWENGCSSVYSTGSRKESHRRADDDALPSGHD